MGKYLVQTAQDGNAFAAAAVQVALERTSTGELTWP
jgi:hypothetical protein